MNATEAAKDVSTEVPAVPEVSHAATLTSAAQEEDNSKRKRNDESTAPDPSKLPRIEERPPLAVAAARYTQSRIVKVEGRLIHVGNLFPKENRTKNVPCIVVNKSNKLKKAEKGLKLVRLEYIDPVSKSVIVGEDIKTYADVETVVSKLQQKMKEWISLRDLVRRSKKKEVPRWKVLEEFCVGTYLRPG
mmetsp:Transcript_1703/g.1945  ORF Transcript_1703/g.1945 Transcript_1703/m.1945 type:complete len:189 (+) Transcript_1703:202-768(+)|eukprot:CAMPEP_0184013732 /NCGR_PEP_ID=MMETSP0954-20121128/5190_1 /TAXON_ID=627963 /ORGANISM="Aplanochytrium sp, Strain PBS07" /LENGTH=188 /DNA_ID=CAMNT_0026293981 /DNA_START=124 /DNA_END=690 /DNA_ORIENTATION=+